MKIISTKSTDGITFKGLLSEPDSPKGIIIHIHGMAGSIVLNSYYQPMHERYSQSGWAFLVGEHRGTGTITQFNSDKGVVNLGNAYEIFEECIYDIQGWVDFAKKLGYTNIWLQSHSLGPSKVAYYVSESNETAIRGLIWISPTDMLGVVHSDEGIKDHRLLFLESQKLIGENKDRQQLSRLLWGDTTLSAQTYLSLFGDDAKDAIFNYANPSLGWDIINSIKLPVLAITGTQDSGVVTVLDANKAMNILESQLSNSPRKKTVVYGNAKHDFNGFEDRIVNDVLEFINS